jgi:ubiquinone/menaquinone biosynthesis C-methylase UbiE
VGEKMNVGNAYINRYTIEALQVSRHDNILEIGMGNGFFVKDILAVDDSIKYCGCDFSAIMIEEANKMNAAFVAESRASFHLCDAAALPFEDASFNKIFTVNTLYFWDNHQATLAEISRVLQPNGQLIIAIRPKETMQHYPFVQYGFTLFSKTALTDFLSCNGFTVTSIIEKDEPPQEIGGVSMKVESLIVCAEKNGDLK